ncbi:MAG TPA: TRAM domain-containing protein [Thermoanaerobaculia bacterium]|nr:TRAM domain-containing protein [Thermoanaerobaculia bacterium]
MTSTPPFAVGALVTAEPVLLVAGGDALARVEGFTLFVPGLYPGDVASVRVTEVKKGFARGEVVEMLKPSEERRVEPCPVAAECGGCDWTSLRLDAQLRAKKKILLDSLIRVGKFKPEQVPKISIHPSPLNYRLRSRLHRNVRGEVGFFARKSHDVVPLSERCEVVGPEVLRNLRRLADTSGTSDIETFEREGFFTSVAAEESVQEVTIDVEGHSFRLSTSSFFQVNRHLLPKMLQLVSKMAGTTHDRSLAIDLYAGVGFFTLPLAYLFERVITVEASDTSHRFARRNTESFSNVEARHVTAEHFLGTSKIAAPFIMVDPPRAGLSHEAVTALARQGTEKICYLSCDPVTFARDAALLSRSGWVLHTLDLVDLFPNTHHLETLSSFLIAR